jgi:hypothetical protein
MKEKQAMNIDKMLETIDRISDAIRFFDLLEIPHKVRCSRNVFVCLRALAQAGPQIEVDPEMTGMDWQVQDRHGNLLYQPSSPSKEIEG